MFVSKSDNSVFDSQHVAETWVYTFHGVVCIGWHAMFVPEDNLRRSRCLCSFYMTPFSSVVCPGWFASLLSTLPDQIHPSLSSIFLRSLRRSALSGLSMAECSAVGCTVSRYTSVAYVGRLRFGDVGRVRDCMVPRQRIVGTMKEGMLLSVAYSAVSRESLDVVSLLTEVVVLRLGGLVGWIFAISFSLNPTTIKSNNVRYLSLCEDGTTLAIIYMAFLFIALAFLRPAATRFSPPYVSILTTHLSRHLTVETTGEPSMPKPSRMRTPACGLQMIHWPGSERPPGYILIPDDSMLNHINTTTKKVKGEATTEDGEAAMLTLPSRDIAIMLAPGTDVARGEASIAASPSYLTRSEYDSHKEFFL
ncbi:hypothetical protein E2P81_ATG00602 [Venturia nashicola]|nr:hypothetical protein E2P81_ATG00602 [Venturia nashicola]